MGDAQSLHAAAPGLVLLLGARSKEVMARVLQDAFDCRFQGWTRDRRRRVCEELSLPEDGLAQEVLIRHALARAGDEGEWLEASLPHDFPPKLLQRVAKALALTLPGWREASVASLLSVPRLLDAECCVVVTAASSVGAASSGAAAVLRLRLEGEATHAAAVPPPRDVTVMLDRATLASAVASGDALRRRLAAVAGQQADEPEAAA